MVFDPRKLQEFALRYTAAWCSRDPQRVASFFAPEGSLAINGEPPAVGRTAIAEAARVFMTAFPDLKVSMDNLIVQPQGGVYHWTLDGTNTGPGGTGKRVHVSGFEQWKMGVDGLIAESQGTFDGAEYQRQIQFGCGATTAADD